MTVHFITYMQMIGLYLDPHGKKIFEISKSVTTNNATETSDTAANLRKKVTELENKLTQVRFESLCCMILPRCRHACAAPIN